MATPNKKPAAKKSATAKKNIQKPAEVLADEVKAPGNDAVNSPTQVEATSGQSKALETAKNNSGEIASTEDAKSEPSIDNKASKTPVEEVLMKKETADEKTAASEEKPDADKEVSSGNKADTDKENSSKEKTGTGKAVISHPDRQLTDMLNRSSSFTGANDPLPTYLL